MGSAEDSKNLPYAHNLIRNIVFDFLEKNSGFIVNVGKEPKLNDTPSIFDWTVLETVAEYYNKYNRKSEPTLGSYVIAFGLKNWQRNIPDDRRELWNYLAENNLVEVIQLKESHSFGGKLRQLQSSMADLLITLGGRKGIDHSVDLFIQKRKPVISLNLPLGFTEMASEYHFTRTCEKPVDYIEFPESYNFVAQFSLLNLSMNPPVSSILIILNDIISNILPPKAFFIRLMNTEDPNYDEVESYFRDVVDPVIEKMDYRRFECGLDESREPFMNIEIFENLHFSSLAFTDLTSLRNNCFLELGYSIGQQKKYIITAKKGTKLPFDTKMIYCHFWDLKNGILKEREKLADFIKHHINKKPLISK